jgi:hypothetical protein
MKKRYVVGLVIFAVAVLAVAGYFAYKNRDDIKDVVKKATKKVKNIVSGAKPDLTKVAPKNVDTIIKSVPTDTKLVADVVEIKKVDNDVQKNTGVVVQKTVGIVAKEADKKKAQGAPLAAIVVENTKQRETAAQRKASKEYVDAIKKIESEKAKVAVLDVAIQAEKKKIQKINALDMEMDLYMSNGLRRNANPYPIRPISKCDAERIVSCMYPIKNT